MGVPAVPVPGPGSCQRGRTVSPVPHADPGHQAGPAPAAAAFCNTTMPSFQQALDGFVQAVIDYGRCPKSIAVCDKHTRRRSPECAADCGILLLRTTRFAMLDEAKASFLDDVNPKEEGGATLEEVVALLEQMPDGELAIARKKASR